MQGSGGATAEPRKGRKISIRPRGWPLRLAVATLAVLAAAGLRWATRNELGSVVPFVFFYPALIVATWFGRLSAGIFALALSAFLSLGFLDPLGRFGVAESGRVFALGSYLLVGAFVVGAVGMLLQSRRRMSELAAIVESSDDAIISVDTGGKILTWNSGASRLFGFDEAEAVSHPIGMLLPPGREDDFDRALSAVRHGERVEHYESVRRRKDGSLVDVSLAVAPIRDARGAIVGVSKVARDVTVHRARERQQARTRELFLGMLGHDLRAPLNGIMVNAQLLQRMTAPPSSEAAARIVSSVERMGRMIDQLLDFTQTRLGAGIPVKPDTTSIRDVWLGVISDGGPELAARVLFSCPEDVIGPWDSDRLAQLFSNLLANALDHGATGEPVAVEVAQSDGAALVEVRNHGAPIPESLRAGIFEPFRRGADSDRRKGLGLGLYIAREIARAHGGSIEAARSKDQTIFRVTLPMHAPADS